MENLEGALEKVASFSESLYQNFLIFWPKLAAWLSEPGNLLSVASFLLSLASIALSYWIYRRQKEESKKIETGVETIKEATAELKQVSEYLKQGVQDSFDVLVSLRNDNLRVFSQLTNNETNKIFWKNMWRFETCEHVTLLFKGISIPVSIKILYTTKDFRAEKLFKTEDILDRVHYICQVDDLSKDKDTEKIRAENDQCPFISDEEFFDFFWISKEKGKRIACVLSGEKVYVKNGSISLTDHWEGKPVEDFRPLKQQTIERQYKAVDEFEYRKDSFDRMATYKINPLPVCPQKTPAAPPNPPATPS
jgi:hypothetical protein